MTRGICPPDHRHAENLTCYVGHKCGCGDCTAGAAEYNYHRRHMNNAGHPRLLPSTGTVRRIQALAWLGWSLQAQAVAAGMSAPAYRKLLRSARVTPRTASRIATIYEAWWNATPTPTTGHQRTAVTRTRRLAVERRWLPPLAWDDIDTDPTPPVPEPIDGYVSEPQIELAMQGEHVRLTERERRVFMTRRRAVVDRLTLEGKTAREISAVTGWGEKMIERDRRATGVMSRLDELDVA